MSKIKIVIIGLITGFFNGLFGAGGGSVLVPCMRRFLNIEVHKSHATSIAIILPLT
ncbi:MAG: sulfite exporter TauE/SafE family protein, partial [Defluviitaleaceae bacterium]|nr:sulfite exporter TauE/SafE family protein [Defluviitaleaceae bacterium]